MAKKITQIEINGETYNVGGSGESVSGNFINQVDDFSQYVPTKWNEIAQYVGTDTPLYKNGYFYKNSGSWIIPDDTPQIAFQSITESGEHAIPIVSPLYEGLSSPVFVGSNAYYGMLSINPTVGGKIFDFLTGTINTITAVTDNGDETYICVTDGGAREETTTYTLDMTKEFDYTERVDAYKNRFIVIEYTDISDYPSSMFGFYIVEETDPNTGTLVENYYPAGLNGCVVTRTTAPVVIDRGTWTRIDVQPTSSSGGSNALVGFILANNKVSIVPLVDCYIENGNLYDPTTHEQIYPTSDTYYYDINEGKVYTPDESYELVDVTNSVLRTPTDKQVVVDITDNSAYWYDQNNGTFHHIVDNTKAPNAPTFATAQTRENIKGDGTENTATLWGKVKKWFSDLKDLAFIGKPSSNQTTTFLRGDGTWQAPPNTTYTAGQGLVLNGTTFKGGSGTVAHYRKKGNKSGDYILITINSYVAWMLSFKVRIYAGYKCDEYIISGYNNGSSHWYDPQVILINNHGSNRDVKFGYTADYHVWVAIPNDNYFGCDILDVVNGYEEVSFDNLFTLQETSTLSGTTQTTITVSPLAKKSEIPDVSNKVAKAGDSMSGTLTFTTANAINYNANNGNINMIRFKTGDANGHGIIIGGGGLTVIGAGESATTVAAQTSSGGSETMQVCSDTNIEFYTNCQSEFSSAKKSYLDTSGNMYVNGSQVRTGTVAIANGGTGSTTRLGALQNLTNENVGTNAQYFLTITTSWGKGGYTSVADAKTVLGLGSAAYLTANSAASNSTVVQRTGSGYIYANYFNTTCAEANPSSYTSPMGLFTSNDGFIRKASAANFRSMIGAGTSNLTIGTTSSTACAGNDSRLSNSRPASDVYAWAKASTKPSYTASEVSALSNAVTTFSGTGYTAIQVGSNNGGIVIISFAYKPTSSTVSLGVQGTYKSQVIFHAGNRDNILDSCAVFKLTTAGYIQNESGVSTSTTYYGLCVAVRAS